MSKSMQGMESEQRVSRVARPLTLVVLTVIVNWYRNRRENWEDERSIEPDAKIQVPYLFVQATQDRFLPPSMSVGMEAYIPNLRRRESESSHFCQILDPNGINGHLKDWFTEVVLARDD